MNSQKLNELAAKAMGWELQTEGTIQPYWAIKRGGELIGTTGWFKDDWNPSTCADDALVLLEKMCEGRWFLKHWKGGFSCGPIPDEWAVTSVSAPLAMTLCALRAAGIPESEIQGALS